MVKVLQISSVGTAVVSPLLTTTTLLVGVKIFMVLLQVRFITTLNNLDGTTTQRLIPVLSLKGSMGSKPILQFALGSYHGVVLVTSRITSQLYTFGYNYWGQLGDLTNCTLRYCYTYIIADKYFPVPVYQGASTNLQSKNITSVYAGGHITMVITAD